MLNRQKEPEPLTQRLASPANGDAHARSCENLPLAPVQEQPRWPWIRNPRLQASCLFREEQRTFHAGESPESSPELRYPTVHQVEPEFRLNSHCFCPQIGVRRGTSD